MLDCWMPACQRHATPQPSVSDDRRAIGSDTLGSHGKRNIDPEGVGQSGPACGTPSECRGAWPADPGWRGCAADPGLRSCMPTACWTSGAYRKPLRHCSLPDSNRWRSRKCVTRCYIPFQKLHDLRWGQGWGEGREMRKLFLSRP